MADRPFFSYRPGSPLARSTDPITSHQATDGLEMTELRRIVLAHFVRYRRMTDLELEALCTNHGSTFRTRRSELTEAGYIKDSGERKAQTSPGRVRPTNRIVWEITPQGLQAAKVLLKPDIMQGR